MGKTLEPDRAGWSAVVGGLLKKLREGEAAASFREEEDRACAFDAGPVDGPLSPAEILRRPTLAAYASFLDASGLGTQAGASRDDDAFFAETDALASESESPRRELAALVQACARGRASNHRRAADALHRLRRDASAMTAAMVNMEAAYFDAEFFRQTQTRARDGEGDALGDDDVACDGGGDSQQLVACVLLCAAAAPPSSTDHDAFGALSCWHSLRRAEAVTPSARSVSASTSGVSRRPEVQSLNAEGGTLDSGRASIVRPVV